MSKLLAFALVVAVFTGMVVAADTSYMKGNTSDSKTTGWKTYSDNKISFKYPSDWQIQERGSVVAAVQGQQMLYVKYDEGFVNNTQNGAMTQCAAVDDVLMRQFNNFRGNPNVTFSEISVGRRGGRSIEIQNNNGSNMWVNAIPLQNVLVSIGAAYHSAGMWDFRKNYIEPFADAVSVTGAKKLPKDAYCSYYMP